MSVIDSVLRDAHVFRNGRETAASKKLTAERISRIQKIIEECKVKATALKTKHREARRSTHKIDPVLGQRVLVPGDRWDIAGYCAGVVTSRGKFIPRGERKKQIGYCVKYVEDDVTEWWKVEDLEAYFVHGDVTAETNPDMKDLQIHDRVYASWESGDEWYYGVVEQVYHSLIHSHTHTLLTHTRCSHIEHRYTVMTVMTHTHCSLTHTHVDHT